MSAVGSTHLQRQLARHIQHRRVHLRHQAIKETWLRVNTAAAATRAQGDTGVVRSSIWRKLRLAAACPPSPPSLPRPHRGHQLLLAGPSTDVVVISDLRLIGIEQHRAVAVGGSF